MTVNDFPPHCHQLFLLVPDFLHPFPSMSSPACEPPLLPHPPSLSVFSPVMEYVEGLVAVAKVQRLLLSMHHYLSASLCFCVCVCASSCLYLLPWIPLYLHPSCCNFPHALFILFFPFFPHFTSFFISQGVWQSTSAFALLAGAASLCTLPRTDVHLAHRIPHRQ